MDKSFAEVCATRDRYPGVDLRTATYILALERIVEASELRGIYP